MATRLEILWSPISNRFITWGCDSITLYEVKPLQALASKVTKISNTHGAEAVNCASNQHYLRCLDVYPKCDKDLLLAIGHSNGKITLTTFGQLEWDSKVLPGKDLVPKYPRPCSSVHFNPVESQLLAAGLEKYKPDNCIMIWDITQISTNEDRSGGYGSSDATIEVPKPVWEFGMSENCQNVSWFYNNSKILATGMNMKFIKLFDIRDPSRVVSSTVTKAAFGVCTNPKDDKYLASYFDNQIYIWDTRNIEKPIQILPQNRPVIKVGWCPTKNCVLTTLQRDSTFISLYDIEHPIIGNEEVEPSILERIVNPGSTHQLTSFSWHPTEENRILSVAASGKTTNIQYFLAAIMDYQVFDRITLNWTPQFSFVWSHGRKSLKCLNSNSIPGLDDLSAKIKERAIKLYGLEDELYKNADYVKGDEVLANVWNWLHLSAKLVDDGKIISSSVNTSFRHPGILSVLKIDVENNPSDAVTVSWADLGHPNCGGSAKYYKHEDRNKALLLCSWPTERDSPNLAAFIENLEREGAYARAAAIAVFNLKVQLAIDILSRAPNETDDGLSLNVVAMALSGFSDDPNSVWKKFCANSTKKLSDPYLKAMFAFLTSENNYDCVLNESNIAVDDRVAFACVFLSDLKLMEYTKKLCTDLIELGNLDGLLLTGNSFQGLKLLQKYLDVTGDIQSTTLIAVRAFHNELSSPVIRSFIENYQELLNKWKLWFERADFDLMVVKYKNEKPPPQIYMSCTYCGKNISAHLRNLKSQQFSRLNISGSSNKLTGCPHCRKPLPRCTICLMNMGTPIGDIESVKPMDFDNWFTWCQNCRHGGHSRHMINWFQDHLECPMVGCTCRCFSLDYIAHRN